MKLTPLASLPLLTLAVMAPQEPQQEPRVIIETELGSITIELHPAKAPVTVGNFLQYVDEGRFEGATFYRVVRPDNQPNNEVKIEVIQGGPRPRAPEDRLPPIEHETTEMTGIRHLDGVISMARNRPGSASSESGPRSSPGLRPCG